ncbi:MAG: hypothetical protein AAFY60_04410, partial [Myxococcota bacterium]
PTGLRMILPTAAVVDNGTYDLLLDDAEGSVLFRDVTLDDTVLCARDTEGLQCDQEDVELTTVCVGSTLRVVEALSQADGGGLFVAGCGDGRVQVLSAEFELDMEIQIPGLEPGLEAVDELAIRPESRFRQPQILAVLPDAGVVQVLSLRFTDNELRLGPSYRGFANTAIRDPADRSLATSLNDLSLSSVEPDLPCEVTNSPPAEESAMEEAARLRNLRLRDGDCVNASGLELPAVELDVDGQLRDCEPDVGGSELSSQPGDCP